jgi:hypothetical protein
MTTLNTTVTAPVAHAETASYVYSKLDLSNLYSNNKYASSTLTKYLKSWVSVGGDVSFVYDYVTARTPGGGHRSLYWHIPTSGATTSAAGALVSNAVGSSKLWISTLLPSTTLVTHFEQDYQSYSGFTINTTGATAPGSPMLNVPNPILSFTTTIATASGSLLVFGPMPAGVTAGMTVTDVTNPSVIQAGTVVSQVQQFAPIGVKVSKPVTGAGVAIGDTIQFQLNLPGMAVAGAGIPDGTTILSTGTTTATMSANATGGGVTNGEAVNFTLTGSTNAAKLYSQRLVVDDSSYLTNATTPFLTVLASTSSGASAPRTTLLSPSGFVGAFYDDGAAPRIVLFSADGTPRTSATYAVSYDSHLAGRHVVLDLTPGFYSVWKDGVILFSGILVGKDGSLGFLSNGGGTFAVGLAAVPSAAFQGRGAISGQTALR